MSWRAYFSRMTPALLGLVVFGALALNLRARQRAAIESTELALQLDELGAVRPVAEVAEAARALKLVTVTLDAPVRAARESRCWRGVTRAEVEAPAHYLFGVDLSQLPDGAIQVGPLGAIRLTAPPPELIAVEVQSDAAREDVSVSGLRFKSLSGQTQLRAAQKSLPEEARRQAFTSESIAQVREISRQQIERLLGRLLSAGAVHVRFEEPG